MLKFFRKIRKGLIDAGRVRRYLLYAAGEIILVVVGILIALQVNNWQQEKRARIHEYDVLEQLKTGFESNDLLIAKGIERFERELGIQMLYLQNTGPEATMPDESVLGQLYSIKGVTVNLAFGSNNSIVLNDYFDHTTNRKLKEAILAFLGDIPQYVEWEIFDHDAVGQQRDLYAKYYSLATNDPNLANQINSAYPSGTIDWLRGPGMPEYRYDAHLGH